jgi:hypothetical protein
MAGGPGAASPPRGATESTASSSSNERYRFVGKDQGTVEDSRPGLQWMRCSLGQTWNGATCTGEATKYKWDEARRIAPAGWRLPTKEELASLVYCSSGKPAYWKPSSETCEGAYGRPTIWSAVFPNTPASWFWSSSPGARYPDGAWYVQFRNGDVSYGYKDEPKYVRLVRDGQAGGPGASPNERYRFVGKDQGIVEDIRTKLQWQRCSLGQTWNGATCTGEAKEYTWDEAQRTASAGWRLPTKDELASLVYCSSGEPAYWKKTASEGASERCEGPYRVPTIWSAAFPNTPASLFWSSSPYAHNAYNAWYVGFGNGDVNYDYEHYANYVRLVRGGQSGSPGAASPLRGATEAAPFFEIR